MDKHLTFAQARALIEEKLAEMPLLDGDSAVILDDLTIEKPFGWVFFYNSRCYLQTGDCDFALFGNAPFIVNRYDGIVTATGTAHPVEHYISEYEARHGSHAN